MADTRSLLNRITAFRERLESIVPLSPVAGFGRELACPVTTETPSSIRNFSAKPVNEGPVPNQLTLKARKLLEFARDLVAEQKAISSDPYLVRLSMGQSVALAVQEADPLANYHRSTVAMTEAALRMVQNFPDSAEMQLRMCDGVETMLSAVQERLGIASSLLTVRREESDRIHRLAQLLSGVAAGQMVPLTAFVELAEKVLEDARKAAPLRFHYHSPSQTGHGPNGEEVSGVALFTASASLNTAQVVARVVHQDYEWAARPLLPVVAALLMDVGMLKVGQTILAKPGSLTLEEKRTLERHSTWSAEMVRNMIPEAGALADSIACHHERPDGTGYPNGRTGDQIPSLSKLLAVCQEYAALATDRPHRPAFDPRTALTDSLLAAEQGKLDKDFCEYLLQLTFHPVGTVVELSDGRTAVVIAIHTHDVSLRHSSRPVVAVLADRDGKLLARPEYLDLSAASHGGIARSLPQTERRRILAERYPELC